MEHEEKKKPVWTLILSPLGVILLTVCLLIGVLGVLAFGNPSDHKYIFMFQTYVWPKKKHWWPKNYTGIFRQWWANGQLKCEFHFVKGKLNGKIFSWHENGQIKYEHFHKNDEMDGKILTWDENGQKRFEGNYLNGREIGKIISWYDNGQKMSECKYKNGIEIGKEVRWHKNGQKESETDWISEGQGEKKIWNVAGDLIGIDSIKSYQTIISKYFKYDEIYKIESYKPNKQVVIMAEYFKKGEKIKEETLDPKTGKLVVTFEKK